MMAWVIILLPVLVLARSPIQFRQAPQKYNTITTYQTNSTIFSGAGGSSSADLHNPWRGAQSNRLTAGNAAIVFFEMPVSPSVNICNDSFFRMTYRMANKNNVMNLNQLKLYFLNDASNYIAYEFGSYAIRDSSLTYWGEWNHYHLARNLFATVGTFNCATVNTVLVDVRAQPGAQDTITIGEVASYSGQRPTGVLLIDNDDQWDGWRVHGAPKLDSLCYDYTMYLNCSRLGEANFTSALQLDSMFFRSRCSRPEFANHLWAHDDITTLSADAIIKSLRQNREYILNRGWCRPGQCAAGIFAYPFGAKSRFADSVIRRQTNLVQVARTVKGNGGAADRFDDIYSTRLLMSLGTGLDTTTAKAAIDILVSRRSMGILLTHSIGPVGCTEDANTWCKDKWIALMNHVRVRVNAGQLRVMSTGDYLQQYGGGFGPLRRAGVGR